MSVQLTPGRHMYAVCGQLTKLEPWSMKDEKTGEENSGYAGQIQIWGATVKIGCDELAYRALRPYVGRVVQVEGEATCDRKTFGIKCTRVNRALCDNQEIFGAAERSPAGAADPAAVAKTRAGVFGKAA